MLKRIVPYGSPASTLDALPHVLLFGVTEMWTNTFSTVPAPPEVMKPPLPVLTALTNDTLRRIPCCPSGPTKPPWLPTVCRL